MSVLDLESLIAPLSSDAPGGENLEYDPAFIELEKLMQGKPEVQYGDTVVPAEPPDWKQTRRIALELCERTRDLRVAMHLCRTLLHTDGWPGFADGVVLLKGYVGALWSSVHPQLDPDDDNDPTFRVNVLASLCDASTVLREARDVPLVSSRAHGRFSLREIEMALDEAPPPKEGEKPSLSTIEAAFLDEPLEALQATAAALEQAASAVTGLESELTMQVGASQSADLSELARLLSKARGIVAERVASRGGAPAESAESSDDGGVGQGGGAAPGAAVQRIAGEITNRDDVIRALDKICDYYQRAEPASPVPLLLQRAKRLVSMDFMELLRDLAPEGISPAGKIFGVPDGDESS